jgi:hypothetical protein
MKAERVWFIGVQSEGGERMQTVNPVKLTGTSGMKPRFIGGEDSRDVF